MDILVALSVIVAWIALQKWVLPKFGVPTWMEPTARRGPAEKENEHPSAE